MKSTFKLTLAIALCLGSSQALALQLGQIRVKSALDEPLVAEIPIQLDNLTEAQGLNVSLASDADFTRAGLSRAGLEHLRFSVVNDTTGHKVVLVTSDQPIGDPYLDFLLQVNTAKGKQLREYTVLLDPVIAASAPQIGEAPAAAPIAGRAAPAETAPPVSQPTPATPPSSMFSAPVQQPNGGAPAPVRAAPLPQPARPAPSAPPSTAAPAQSRNGEYRVGKGDTLYHIANQTRPDAQVSVDQMMLALQKTNPDAFYRANINALKSGAILRIPTRDAVNAATLADARAQVHRQMEDWSGVAARKATTVVENNTAPVAQPAPGKPAAASDRLALVPPSQGGGAAASHPGQKGGTGNAEIAGLKQQLAGARESLTSLKQENGDLQSRVKDLEDISGKNQKLLSMKDAQIAELQRKLAEAQQQAAKPVAPASNVAATAAGSAPAPKAGASAAPPVPATGTTAAHSNAPSAAVAGGTSINATQTPATTPAMRPTSEPAAAQNETIEVPWYRQPIAWVIGGVVILALILLGLLRRRPRPLPEPEVENPSLADHFGTSPLAPAPATPDDNVQEPPSPVHGEASSEGEAAEPIEEAAPSAEDEYGFAFDDLPAGEPVAEVGMAAPQEPIAGTDEITREYGAPAFADHAQPPAYRQQPPATLDRDSDDTREHPVPAFSDDPVDTKLDLARAYLDMGDPAGARAMLEEVLNEGSQTQKDEAQKLLEGQT